METAKFDAFLSSFTEMAKEEQPQAEKIRQGRILLSRLTSSENWFQEHLARLIFDPVWRNSQKPGIWQNEITLHRSSNPAYVVLAYFWETGMVDTVHDHGSWGVVGCLFGRMDEIRYQRLDDGSREGFADLRPQKPLLINPGETTAILPLDQGIHRLGNAAKSCSITINVYGKPVRKGYIRFFDPETKKVHPAYPPSTQKAAMAIRSLAEIDKAWAEDLLRSAMREPLPDYLKKECDNALYRRESVKAKPGMESE